MKARNVQILTGFNSGSSTGTLTVNAPVGATVSASMDGEETRTLTVGSDGKVIFEDLAFGQWTISLTDPNDESKVINNIVNIVIEHEIVMDFMTAFINVTFPFGAICKCKHTETGVEIFASSNNGNALFEVHKLGQWTVSCDNGLDAPENKSGSQIINITENGQIENVELKYILELVKNGFVADGYTCVGGARSGNYMCVGATVYSTASMYFTPAVLGYSKMTVTGTTSNNPDSVWVGVVSDYSQNSGSVIAKFDGASGTIDLSSISTPYYVKAGCRNPYDGKVRSIMISNITLE